MHVLGCRRAHGEHAVFRHGQSRFDPLLWQAVEQDRRALGIKRRCHPGIQPDGRIGPLFLAGKGIRNPGGQVVPPGEQANEQNKRHQTAQGPGVATCDGRRRRSSPQIGQLRSLAFAMFGPQRLGQRVVTATQDSLTLDLRLHRGVGETRGALDPAIDRRIVRQSKTAQRQKRGKSRHRKGTQDQVTDGIGQHGP